MGDCLGRNAKLTEAAEQVLQFSIEESKRVGHILVEQSDLIFGLFEFMKHKIKIEHIRAVAN